MVALLGRSGANTPLVCVETVGVRPQQLSSATQIESRSAELNTCTRVVGGTNQKDIKPSNLSAGWFGFKGMICIYISVVSLCWLEAYRRQVVLDWLSPTSSWLLLCWRR